MTVDYDKVPVPYMKEAVQRYVEKGISPGGFLSSVISNNLSGAVTQADATNSQYLKEWVMFFIWEVPAACYGSPEAYARWLDDGGYDGLAQG